jgi:hypothetical protein
MTISTIEAPATFAGQDLRLQYTAGQWRQGQSAKTFIVTNPLDDSVPTTIR